MKVLVTGGAGFIGATVASACIDAGHVPIILDDLSTGSAAFTAGREFFHGDVGDADLLAGVFAAHPDIAAAVHCAAHIVVPESVSEPTRYYRNNVAKTIDLIDALARHGCRRLLFSSSASIYATPSVAGTGTGTSDFGVDEAAPVAPASPYAHTKAMVEQVLADAAAAGLLRAVALRYFNPIGADPKRRTGQQVLEPTHVLGRLLAALRDGTPFTVTGTDWPTRDGSAIRDYIHVWDLAEAHVRALERFDGACAANGFGALNIGTGRGTTVRELVAAFERATGGRLQVQDGPRRPGDALGAFARVERAAEVLGWRSRLSIADGVRDALGWLEVRDQALAGR